MATPRNNIESMNREAAAMQDWPSFIKEHFSTVPFFRFLEAKVETTSRGQARLQIKMKPEYANTYGIAHGGIIAALVDMAAGVALRTLKVRIVTVETSTSYYTAVSLTNKLIADAKLTHEGKKILHAKVDIYSNDNTIVAQGKAIFYILGEDTGEY
jgi:acyl-CoA thioesterase